MRRFTLIIVVGLICHLGIAAWNGFWGPSIGAESDAVKFHESAVDVVHGNFAWDQGFGVNPYVFAIGLLYTALIPHVFVSSLASVIAWWVGTVLLTRCLHRLFQFGIASHAFGLLLIALSPSVLINTSVQLREAFQFMFLAFVAVGQFQLMIETRRSGWLWMIVGSIGAAGLHGGLFLPCVASMLFVLWFKRDRSAVAKVASMCFAAILALIGLLIFLNFGSDLDGNLAGAVAKYQDGLVATEGRANYLSAGDFDTLPGLVLSLPVSLFGYFFEPMPWRGWELSDFLIFCENLVRAALIWFAIRNYLRSQGRLRAYLAASILMFFLCEAIWSLGTGNWGTAARHHVPSIVLLFVAASVNVPSRKVIRIERSAINHRNAPASKTG